MVNLQPGGSQGIASPPSKRTRVLLTPEEKDALKASYDKEPYPTQATIDALAAHLKLPTSTVINWFHNHRSRLKRGAANVDPENRLVFHTHTESDMSARHALMQEEVARRAALSERLGQEDDSMDEVEDDDPDAMGEEPQGSELKQSQVNDLKQAIVALENASREEEGAGHGGSRYPVRQPREWTDSEVGEDDDADYEEEYDDQERFREERSRHHAKTNGAQDKGGKNDDAVHRLQNGVKDEKDEWEF